MAKTLKFTDGDMVRLYTNTGYEYVEDREKGYQDVALILTTDVRVSTGLGCGLDKVIGKDTMAQTNALAQFPAVFDFQNSLRIGLSRLKNAQKAYMYGQRTPGELIYDFSPAEIWAENEDPRNFKWSVSIITVSGRDGYSLAGSTRV